MQVGPPVLVKEELISQHEANLKELILQLIPKDGSSIGNIKLQQQLTEAAAFSFDEEGYKHVCEILIAEGVLGKDVGVAVRYSWSDLSQ